MIHVYPLYTFTHGGDVPTQYPSYALYMPILTLSLSRSACVHMYCIYIMYVCIQLYRHHIIQSKYKIVQTDNSDIISTHVYIYIYTYILHAQLNLYTQIDQIYINRSIARQIHIDRQIPYSYSLEVGRQIPYIQMDTILYPPKKREQDAVRVHLFIVSSIL